MKNHSVNALPISGISEEGVQLLPHAPAHISTNIYSTLSADEIRQRATRCLNRFRLRNGETGWPFSRIVPKDQISGATEAWLVDPYLAAPHQRRNLKEFIDIVVQSAKLKTLTIASGLEESADSERDREFFDRLDREVYEQAGTRITILRTPDIHDRFAIFNNGIVLKFGRGLDSINLLLVSPR